MNDFNLSTTTTLNLKPLSPESSLLVISPPPVSNDTGNGQWHKGEIKYTGVQSAGRFLPQLLGCFSANRTLGPHRLRKIK